MKVEFEGDESLIGELVRVKITKAGYPLNEGHVVRVIDHASNRSEFTAII